MKQENTNERLLPMTGAYNMRDLGGYKNIEGNHVKRNTFIRSDDLGNLTITDLEYLAHLPLRTVIDFRGEEEKRSTPDRLPETVSKYIQLPIEAGDISDIARSDKNDMATVMEQVYGYIIRNQQSTYSEFFKIISVNKNTPLLFHCSAGKDRTGIAAALLLSALGVDRKTVIEDYMLSAKHIPQKYEFITKAHPELKPLVTVKEEYIETAFHVMDKEYGGVENYLVNNLGADIKKLRELYTE